MLGRLARWVRALGYDTLYDAAWDDAFLAEVARREQRVLLTRDVELTKRRGVVSVLIADDKVMAQLTQLLRELNLDDAGAFTRCIECNAELRVTDAAEIAAHVPPYVLATQTQFKACPQCRKIYWRGTHWNHMRAALRAMEQKHE
jgi:hypothetical protein